MSLPINLHHPDDRSCHRFSQNNRLLYSSPVLQIGQFRCPPWSPSFSDSGPADGYLIVFPRTSVQIRHEGKKPVVADPNVVMLYNQGQVYSRDQLSERGDYCDWFRFNPQSVIQAVRSFDPAVDERWDQPFRFSHGPSDPETYLLQRLAMEHIRNSKTTDRFFIDEAMLLVLDRVLANTYQLIDKRPSTRRSTSQAHVDLVFGAKAYIATKFDKQVTVEEIANATHSSVFHLCRVFRKYTGMTLHHYINQVRLKASLEFVAKQEISLTEIGLALGYASHSHFTKAFRLAFGSPPSSLRGQPSIGRIREMSKILTA